MNSTAVDVVVGLVLIYGMLSSICSVLNEYIQRIFDARARQLERALQTLLADRDGALFTAVKNHVLVRATSQTSTAMPSYLPASTFAQALFDALVARVNAEHPLTFKRLRDGIQQIPERSDARTALLSLASAAEGDLAAFRARVEQWFDDAMDRLSGTYKRHVTLWLLALGFVVAAATNADTHRLVQRIAHESALRSAVAARAGDLVVAAQRPASAASPPASPVAPDAGAAAMREPATGLDLQTDVEQLQQLDVMFWDTTRMTTAADAARYPLAMRRPEQTASWLGWLARKLVGLVLTALAISIGAPFWFDLLGRAVNLRSTGPRPTKTTARSAATSGP